MVKGDRSRWWPEVTVILGSFFLNDDGANAYSSINKWRVAVLEKGECVSESRDWERKGSD